MKLYTFKPNTEIEKSVKQNDTESLQFKFGKVFIQIDADGFIKIANGKSTIMLNPDGVLKLEAETIKQHARENIELNAEHQIHLNSD